MSIFKKKVLFYLVECVLVIASFYISIFTTFSFVFRLFMFTSRNSYDFITPALFAIPVAIFLVAAPLSYLWYWFVFKKMR